MRKPNTSPAFQRLVSSQQPQPIMPGQDSILAGRICRGTTMPKRAPGHSRRTHRKGYRTGQDRRQPVMTSTNDGISTRVKALTDCDIVERTYVSPEGTPDGITLENSVEHQIESSENELTCELAIGCPGALARTTLIRIGQFHNDDLIVRNEATGESHTIGQVLRLPGQVLAGILADSALTIKMPGNAIPRHRLPSSRRIKYQETQTRVTSPSCGHLQRPGPAPGQDGRGRNWTGEPNQEELDRREVTDGSRIMPAGGQAELERNARDQEDYHADNLAWNEVDSPDG